jgi:cobalamin biosynthesis protein CobC
MEATRVLAKQRVTLSLPEHGGDLVWAAKTFNRPVAEWLDLSTAISPWMYPIPSVPDTVWQRLPYNQGGLLQAAAQYYQCDPQHLIPVSGSQAAITHIPTLLSRSSVAIPEVAYREHEYSWRKAGHSVCCYRSLEHLQQLVK